MNEVQDKITSDIDYIVNVLHKQYFNAGKLYLIGYTGMTKKNILKRIDSMCLEYYDCYTKEDRIVLLNKYLAEEEKLKIF